MTEAKINEAREHYRPAAARASLLYFIMNDLNKIHPMYQFALKVALTTDPELYAHSLQAQLTVTVLPLSQPSSSASPGTRPLALSAVEISRLIHCSVSICKQSRACRNEMGSLILTTCQLAEEELREH